MPAPPRVVGGLSIHDVLDVDTEDALLLDALVAMFDASWANPDAYGFLGHVRESVPDPSVGSPPKSVAFVNGTRVGVDPDDPVGRFEHVLALGYQGDAVHVLLPGRGYRVHAYFRGDSKEDVVRAVDAVEVMES